MRITASQDRRAYARVTPFLSFQEQRFLSGKPAIFLLGEGSIHVVYYLSLTFLENKGAFCSLIPSLIYLLFESPFDPKAARM